MSLVPREFESTLNYLRDNQYYRGTFIRTLTIPMTPEPTIMEDIPNIFPSQRFEVTLQNGMRLSGSGVINNSQLDISADEWATFTFDATITNPTIGRNDQQIPPRLQPFFRRTNDGRITITNTTYEDSLSINTQEQRMETESRKFREKFSSCPNK